ncbi:MAG: GvpL/GvpF family gas vesicle protein, partial [Nitrospinota bacterium]
EAQVVRCGEIGAVVKDRPLRDLDGMDEGELKREIGDHHRVNELAMEQRASVPVRFGVIAESEDEVKRWLERAHLQFRTALERVRGKAEFAIHVHWDEGSLIREIGAKDEQVQRLRAELSTAPPEQAQSLQIAVGQVVYATLHKRRQVYLSEVHRALRACSTHWALGRLTDDTMIANLAFLVEGDKRPHFDARLDELGERYAGQLRLKCIGPLPPYSFCDIEFSLGSFELIDGARKRLGLGEQASLDEIKSAYRNLAVRHHPDKNPHLQQSAERFKEIVSAYETLVAYCRNYRYSFRREAVEGSFSFAAPDGWGEDQELCAEGQPHV